MFSKATRRRSCAALMAAVGATAGLVATGAAASAGGKVTLVFTSQYNGTNARTTGLPLPPRSSRKATRTSLSPSATSSPTASPPTTPNSTWPSAARPRRQIFPGRTRSWSSRTPPPGTYAPYRN